MPSCLVVQGRRSERDDSLSSCSRRVTQTVLDLVLVLGLFSGNIHRGTRTWSELGQTLQSVLKF